MAKKEPNLVIILILLFTIHFILMYAFGTDYSNQATSNIQNVQKSPQKETIFGSLTLIALAVIIYIAEKRYKYTLE